MSNPIILPLYKYNELAEDEIRLLRLEPGPWASELEGRLLTYKLDIELDDLVLEQVSVRSGSDDETGSDDDNIAPEYEALSYLWGNEEAAALLRLVTDDDEEAAYLTIRPNLEEALKRFRSKYATDQPLLIWIDSICINQKDSPEQSAQIRKMADIYSQAIRVRVWLGKETEDSTTAIRFVQRLLSFKKFDDMSRDPVSAAEWNAFRNLMQRPWFKRRWIVQEIAFAREARVYCGRDELPWKDLASAVSLFALKKEELRDLFQKAPDFDHNPDYLGEVEGFGAKTLVDTIDIVLRKSEDGAVMEHLLPLEALTSILTVFDASIPHDYIYAILRLSSDARPGSKRSFSSEQDTNPRTRTSKSRLADSAQHEKVRLTFGDMTDSPDRISSRVLGPPSPSVSLGHPEKSTSRNGQEPRGRSRLRPPEAGRGKSRSASPAAARRKVEREFIKPPKQIFVDYDKSVYSLCKEFVEFAVGRSQSLDIICRPWVPPFSGPQKKIALEDTLPMPSWLLPISKRPYEIRPQTDDQVYSRVAADSLVGTSVTALKNYSASGKTPAFFLSEPSQLISKRRLRAHGFIVDSIGDSGPAALNGLIPASWLELNRVDWLDQSGEPPESFWRTLVANRASSKGPERPPAYWQSACKWMFDRRLRHESANLDPAQLLMQISGECPSVVKPFLQRVRAVVWNRRLFESGTNCDSNSRALLGLAPNGAKRGDLICILYGCSVPVLLRKKTKSFDQKTQRKRKTEDDQQSTSPDKRRRGQARKSSSRKQSKLGDQGAAPEMPMGAEPPVSSDAHHTLIPPEIVLSASSGSPADEPRGLLENSQRPRSPVNHSSAAEAVSEDEYILIGECYVHEMMDGEAFQIQRKRRIANTDFWIV